MGHGTGGTVHEYKGGSAHMVGAARTGTPTYSSNPAPCGTVSSKAKIGSPASIRGSYHVRCGQHYAWHMHNEGRAPRRVCRREHRKRQHATAHDLAAYASSAWKISTGAACSHAAHRRPARERPTGS